MILQIYSIRDAATEHFTPPFFARAEGEALRNFQALVAEPQSTIHRNPEHFDLYYLGTFDDQNGQFNMLPTPSFLKKAIEFVKPVFKPVEI